MKATQPDPVRSNLPHLSFLPVPPIRIYLRGASVCPIYGRVYGEGDAGKKVRGLDPGSQAGEGLLTGAIRRSVSDRQIVHGDDRARGGRDPGDDR